MMIALTCRQPIKDNPSLSIVYDDAGNILYANCNLLLQLAFSKKLLFFLSRRQRKRLSLLGKLARQRLMREDQSALS